MGRRGGRARQGPAPQTCEGLAAVLVCGWDGAAAVACSGADLGLAIEAVRQHGGLGFTVHARDVRSQKSSVLV